MRLPILGIIAILSTFAPVIAGFIRRRVLKGDSAIVFSVFVALSGLSICELVLARLSRNNLWVGQVSTLIETVVMLLLFAGWVHDRAASNVFRGIAVAYSFFWFVLKLTIESLDKPSKISVPISTIILVTSAIFVLFQFSRSIERSIVLDWRFWIVTSLLIKSSTNIMFFALMDVIIKLPIQETVQIFSFFWILVTISNLINAGGMLCVGYRPNSGGRLASAL